MICVLDVTAGPARGQRFWIRDQESVEIGRISTADFSVPADRHMSRHHLILEGLKNSFRLRDVGSANGTYVNDAKVTSIELCDGDRIKAGETVLEVSVIHDTENPHAKDISFDGARGEEEAVAISNSSSHQKVEKVFVAAHGSDSDQQEECDADASGSASRQKSITCARADSGRNGGPSSSDVDATSRCSDSDIMSVSDSAAVIRSGWWKEFSFAEDGISHFYKQAHGAEERYSVSCILRRLERDYAITAVVNVEGLRRFDRQLIEGLLEEGLVTRHTSEVCSILNSCSRDFHLLIESLLSQDAVILLGTKTGMDPGQLSKICHRPCRPSDVAREVQDGSEDSPLLRAIRGVDFLLYEQDSSGCLNLLLAS